MGQGVWIVGQGRWSHQQTAAAQFTPEVSGQTVRHPELAQMAEDHHAAQDDGDADEHLQAEFQHGGGGRERRRAGGCNAVLEAA